MGGGGRGGRYPSYWERERELEREREREERAIFSRGDPEMTLKKAIQTCSSLEYELGAVFQVYLEFIFAFTHLLVDFICFSDISLENRN